MNNIEKYVGKFEEAYEKTSKQLMNIDNEIDSTFDSLNDSDKLFFFAKKLIMKNNDFLNIKRIAELEKELKEKNKKIIGLQETNKILDEDCFAYELKYDLYKENYEQLLEKNTKLKEKNKKIIELQEINKILDEDCFAYELKYDLYQENYEQLLEKNTKLKEKIRGKIIGIY